MAQPPAEIFVPPPLAEGGEDELPRRVRLYLLVIAVVSFGAGLLIGRCSYKAFVLSTLPPPSTVSALCPTAPSSSADEGLMWVVYVSGAVQHPQVVNVPPGSLVADALAAAGGPAPEADLDAVNLAAPLQNYQHVHIPARPATSIAGVTPTPRVRTTPSALPLININTADEATLELLPKIGPSMAQRIIEYRQAHGPFQTIADIQKVTGIGPSIFAAIEPYITVGP